jgi:hypothetical protein
MKTTGFSSSWPSRTETSVIKIDLSAPTWLAAKPIPLALRIVSNILCTSSINFVSSSLTNDAFLFNILSPIKVIGKSAINTPGYC